MDDVAKWILYEDDMLLVLRKPAGIAVESAKVTEKGGAVFVNSGYFTLEGGTIRDCIAKNGGAIHCITWNINK